jgi:1,4-alpha-glucan branching enzyme
VQRVALVLHAHLPWVREREPWTATERWFHEAMWECYAPLSAWLAGHDMPMTLSVSPPLLAMMRDPILAARLRDHLAVLADLNHTYAPNDELRAHYAERLNVVAEGWLTRLRACNHVQLMSTSITHAFLPGLGPVDGSYLQLALGLRTSEWPTRCVWLPECGWTPRIDATLAALDVKATVLAEHGVTLSRPPVSSRVIESPAGVAYAGRSRAPCLAVWSSEHGYPGHPAYRDFYRDLGFDRDGLGPLQRGTMTGLKYHRITSRRMGAEALYEPEAARRRVAGDAEDFVQRLVAAGEEDTVLAFDAELFGHWWHEGLAFLDAVLRGLAARGVLLVTLDSLAARRHPVAAPAISTWGRGGFSRDWVNPRTVAWWRRIHRAHHEVTRTARGYRGGSELQKAALTHAIEQMLFAEASDWLYMIANREHGDYAAARLHTHLRHALRYADIAGGAMASRAEAIRIDRPRTVTAAVGSDELHALSLARPSPS